jgi:hypothetical protein
MVLHTVRAKSSFEQIDDAAVLELPSKLSVSVKSRKPALRSLRNAAGTSG